MADCTQLWYNGRLMNEITPSSRFKTIPNAKVDTPEQREAVARNLMDGWVQNASYDSKLFEIVHTKTKPVKLSKMTEDIIRRSRENLGT